MSWSLNGATSGKKTPTWGLETPFLLPDFEYASPVYYIKMGGGPLSVLADF